MNEFFNRIATQVREIWGGLSRSQRIWLGVLGGATLAGLIAVAFISSRTVYTELGTFEIAEAAAIRAELDRAGFRFEKDYKLANDGRTILVDAQRRNEAHISLGEAGLLGQTEKGFKIFEEFDITTTDYEQRLRNIEALKSTMRQMIRQYAQVEDVVITVPHVESENIFTDKEVAQTAAVVLTLKPGSRLEEQQIKAIRGLIASGFPGLKDGQISLTDNMMNPLVAGDEESALLGMGPKQIGIVKTTARGLEEAIRKVLGPVLGQDKFTVSVNVEFDWDNVQIAKTEFTSPGFDQLKESEQSEDEKLRGEGLRPGGEPGTTSNAPAYQSINGVGPVDYERQERIVNYLADKTVSERIQSPFVKRISAAVAIDGVWKETKDTDGNVVRTYVPRSEADMDHFRALVEGALGQKREREDVVEVRNVPYNREKEFERIDALRAAQDLQRKMLLGTPILILALVALTILYMMWRKSVRLREEEMARTRELERQKALAAAEAGLAGEISLEDQERQEIQRRATSLARAKPQVVAELVRTWMAEEAPAA